MNRSVVLLPVLLVLSGCSDKGYPTTDAEAWGLVVAFLGACALFGFCWWCLTK